MGPAHDEAAHASNAVDDAGNVVRMVLDFLTNVAYRVSAQRGLEGSHAGSVERLAHGRGVGRLIDEPDVGMRQPMEGQELLADVHSAHVHEPDPWGTVAIGFHDSGLQPCEEGCEGRRRRRPMALRVARGVQRWVVVDGFHGGGIALENELGVNVGHEMPGGKARVHDDVLLASGEPPAFEQRQHLAARLVNVDDGAAVGDSRIVQCSLDLLLAQFSECPCRCFGPLLPQFALGYLEGVPK